MKRPMPPRQRWIIVRSYGDHIAPSLYRASGWFAFECLCRAVVESRLPILIIDTATGRRCSWTDRSGFVFQRGDYR